MRDAAHTVRLLADALVPLTDPVLVVGADGELVAANTAALDLIEAALAAGTPRASQRFWPEPIPLARACEGEAVVDAVVELPAGTDSEAPRRRFRASALPIRDEAGAVAGAYAVLRAEGAEPTEAIEATEAIEGSRAEENGAYARARLRLLDRCPDAFFRYRTCPTPRFEYIGPTIEAILGFTPEEHYANPSLPIERIHPEDRAALESVNMSQADFEKPFLLRFLHRDGSLVWTEQHVAPLLDASGAVVGVEGLIRDISDQKRAEAALQRATAELSAVFDALPDLLFRMKPDGTLIDFSAGRWHNLYVLPEQFLGRRVQDVMPAEAAFPITEALARLAAGSEKATALYTLPGHDGTRHFEARLTPTPDGEVVAVVREFTEARRNELERDRLLARLGDESARLEAVLRQMPSGAVLVDAATRRLVIVNEQLQAILGRRFSPGTDLDTYLDQPWMRDGELLPPSELPVARSLADGETVVGEQLEVLRGDGIRIALQVNAGPVRDAAGRVVAAIAVVSDVTGRRRAEHALRLLVDRGLELEGSDDFDGALERLARMTLPTLADVCAIDLTMRDGERRVVAVHCDPAREAAARELLESLPPASAGEPGEAWSVPLGAGSALRRVAFVPDIDAARLERPTLTERQRALLRELGPRSYAVVPLVVGGRRVGMMALAFCDSGRRYGVDDLPALEILAHRVAVALDNARLYAAAQEARRDAEERAARLGALLEGMSDAVTVIGAGGEMLLRNPAMKRLTNLSDEQFESVLNIPGLQLFTPGGEPVALELWPTARLARGEPIGEEEYILERADGSRRRIVTSGTLLREQDGAFGLAMIIVRDITALRELEEQREDFVRTVSHDLRQPLAVVTTTAELLQRRYAKAPISSDLPAVERILRGARRMSGMIRDLVESARLESGTLHLRCEPRGLEQLLKEIASHVGSPDEQARIVLDLDSGASTTARVDSEQLERAVVNLLTNALKYSPAEAPVTLRLRQTPAEALIAVADCGKGIPADRIPQLFGRYYRAETDATKEGLGLGLYIARLIVKAHGGRIWVDSEPGKGSTFSIALAREQ